MASETVKHVGLLDDLKREYQKSIGWSNLSEQYFQEIKEILDGYDNLRGQMSELANFIMKEVDGEPSQSQGAVDTAIRIIREKCVNQ